MSPQPSQLEADVIRRLLDGAKAAPDPADQPQADDYDWNAPHRLTAAQTRRLQRLTEDAAKAVAQALARLLHAEVRLQPSQPTQHYAPALSAAAAEEAHYAVALETADGRRAGALTLAPQKAAGWVALLLGGGGGQDAAEREMSTLEKAILADAMGAVTAAVSGVIQAAGGPQLGPAGDLHRGEYPLGREEDAYGRVAFLEEGEQPPGGISFIVLLDVLEGAVGPGGEAVAAAAAAEQDVRDDLIRHLERVALPIAVSTRAELTMRDILALEPGDVILTDLNSDEPMDVLVAGRRTFAGRPVASGGRYAVQIAADTNR
jgi:flagellar motor switch protein FliM